MHPVRQKLLNSFGLYDMIGNVREWVEDIYNEKGYRNLPVDGSANLRIGESSTRVLRGGSWGVLDIFCRSATRDHNYFADRFSYFGFRLVARAS